jgi:WD40 repeat protein
VGCIYVVAYSVILSGSADYSILATDVETGKSIARLEDAHEWVSLVSMLLFKNKNLEPRDHSFGWYCRNGINRLVCLTESMVATGDDEGCIKVWSSCKSASSSCISLLNGVNFHCYFSVPEHFGELWHEECGSLFI